MTPSVQQSIERFRARLRRVYLLRNLVAALTIWSFLYGTAVLALRGGAGLSRLDLLWGLVSLPLAVMPAVVLARRRLPSAAAIRAILDRHGRCGGLVMAGEELALGAWEEGLPELRAPEVRWQARRPLALLGGGLAFAALAFLVPQGLANLGPARLDVEREAAQLARKLEVLEKEKVLDRKRSQELQEQLEKVRQDARAGDPVRTLEALDHLHDLASKAARDAAEAAARKNEDLGRSETLTEAVSRAGSRLDNEARTEAMKQLSALAAKAAEEGELLESGLDPATLKALEAGQLSPEQLQDLLEALKECKGKTTGKVGRLVKARVLDPSELEKCEKAGECSCEGLAAFLKENGCKAGLCEGLALCEVPGKGGITRGPGPARLTFGDESNPDGATFKEEQLPPAAMQTLKDARLAGVSVGDPRKNGERPGAASSGALAGAASGGGSASTQVVLPRHRGAVERYFARPVQK